MTMSSEIIFEAPSLSEEESERFRGKHVALVKGKVLDFVNNSKEALREALNKKPELKPDEIGIYYVPAVDELIL
ncbi:MAG: hypothetical protein H3Z51_14590 [archaeon]|nr:hypothetical protein [archaeon]